MNNNISRKGAKWYTSNRILDGCSISNAVYYFFPSADLQMEFLNYTLASMQSSCCWMSYPSNTMKKKIWLHTHNVHDVKAKENLECVRYMSNWQSLIVRWHSLELSLEWQSFSLVKPAARTLIKHNYKIAIESAWECLLARQPLRCEIFCFFCFFFSYLFFLVSNALLLFLFGMPFDPCWRRSVHCAVWLCFVWLWVMGFVWHHWRMIRRWLRTKNVEACEIMMCEQKFTKCLMWISCALF